MTSHAETFCRDRRLFDVKRGVVYLRQTDNLAQRQWRHYGTVPAIKTHVIRDIGVTTRLTDVTNSQYDAFTDQSLIETKDSENDVRGSVSDVREWTSDVVSVDRQDRGRQGTYRTTILEEFSSHDHPQISLTEVTTPNPSRASAALQVAENPKPVSPERQSVAQLADVPTSSFSSSVPSPQGGVSTVSVDSAAVSKDLATTSGSVPAFFQPASTSKHDQHTFRQSHALAGGLVDGAHFDTWGSRDWAVDSKLEADVTPRSHAPKRYPPMSRVGGGWAGKKGAGRRQLRTLTDFRSRNGTVRVIHPLPPVAGSKKIPGDPDEDLDLATLDREQTYAMLKRIDRLLEPSRAFFTSDLASSQQEVCSSSTPSTLTQSLHNDDEYGDNNDNDNDDHPNHGNHVHIHHDNFQKYFEEAHDLGTEPSNGSSEQRDGHQGYYDRIQARLAMFYGRNTDPSRQPTDRSRGGRTNPYRGHSEPPRGRPDPFSQHSEDVEHARVHSFRVHNGYERDTKDSSPSRSRPGLRQPPVLPPMKKGTWVSKEASGEPYNKSSKPSPGSLNKHTHNAAHGHSKNSFFAKSRKDRSTGGQGGPGEKGKGWGSLSEVVKNLEEKGVDLHLKCQEWISASFS